MPRLPDSVELYRFIPGRVVGQEEDGIRQRQIARKLSIPLSTVNRAITQFKNQTKETVEARSGRASHQQDASEALRNEWREKLESQPLICRGDATECDLGTLGCKGGAARSKPLLPPAYIARRHRWPRRSSRKH